VRKLAIAAAVSSGLATFSVNSLALGLGDIELYSALNQALDAEIVILSAAPGELDSTQVRIAPVDAFENAGLERSPVAASMMFVIERRADGSPIIKVTSDAPVVEPFLNFLIEVDSGVSGRQIREYTVLLDPPVFSPEQTELAVANVPESEEVDIDREIGASSLIERSDSSTDAGDELESVVFLDEGELINLDNEITDFRQLDGVEVQDNDNVVVTIDTIESVVLETTAEPALAGDTSVNSGEVLTEQKSESVAAVEGELIPLEAELLGADVFAIGNTEPDYTAPSNPGEGDEGGVLLSLDELSPGRPIFDSEAGQSSNNGVQRDNSFEGAQVDLTDLIPIEIVAAPVPAETAVESLAGVSEEVDTDSSVLIDLTDLTLVDPAENQPEVIVASALDTSALDTSALDTSALDTSALATSAGAVDGGVEGSELDDARVVILDPITDTDAVGEENLGELIDLSGVVTTDDSSQIAVPSDTVSSDAYRVRTQDTLWSIAKANKPSGVSTQQMMVALLEANPEAFLNGDMNQMAVDSLLEMPETNASSAVDRSEALAMVREQTETQPADRSTASGSEVEFAEPAVDADAGDENIMVAETVAPEQEAGLSIVGVEDTAASAGTPATSELSTGADLSRNLDDVNRRVQLAQEELESEAMQRDELQGRVDDLSSSMTKMKRLITLRESELSDLQTELTTTDAEAEPIEDVALIAETDSEDKDPAMASEEAQIRIKEMQEKISDEATLAQDRIAAQADADKNLAAAEAESQRIRLANEQDELKAQLATLRAEKAELEESAQMEKAALVLAAEEEKTALLAQAQAEQERIEARLEAEKVRITAEAEDEKQAIAASAKAENERLIAEANAERDRLALESENMREQLEALEQEKNLLLAQAEIDKQQLQESADENLRLQAEAETERQRADDQARIRERLAEEQAKAAANLASANGSTTTGGAIENTVERAGDEIKLMAGADTDDSADVSVAAVVGSAAEANSDVASKGAAAAGAMGGLMAYAPLQKTIGDRTTALAAGGGLALLGLLGAWAWRRRSRVVKEDINLDSGAVGALGGSGLPVRGDIQSDVAQRRSEGGAWTAERAQEVDSGHATSLDEVREPNDTSDNSRQRRDAVSNDIDQHSDARLQDDTLTEAEVYLKYGLHGQAEELLSSAIERDPDNQDYHMKLLENYHDQKNANGFRSAASTFQDRFGATSYWERVAEMGRDLDPGDSLYSRATAMDIGSAASGAVAGIGTAAGVAVASNLINDRVDSSEARIDNSDDLDDLPDDFLTAGTKDRLDETMDPGEEFDLSELEATGQFDSDVEPASLEDVTLDEIDLAALDDDGTLNLEEVAGEEMSGLDLGAMDFGDSDVDSSLDNLTLDDADLNSLGGVTASLRSGLESDEDLDAGLGSRVDEMETMLDLAKAYIDMGDNKSAVGPLKDIAAHGSPAQQSEASELLRKISG